MHADVREFLVDARRAGRRAGMSRSSIRRTFSNSKRMDYTFDIQRDHAALIADVAAVAGTICFSTNRRRFKLEYDGEVTDETHATTPPDFLRHAASCISHRDVTCLRIIG